MARDEVVVEEHQDVVVLCVAQDGIALAGQSARTGQRFDARVGVFRAGEIGAARCANNDVVGEARLQLEPL